MQIASTGTNPLETSLQTRLALGSLAQETMKKHAEWREKEKRFERWTKEAEAVLGELEILKEEINWCAKRSIEESADGGAVDAGRREEETRKKKRDDDDVVVVNDPVFFDGKKDDTTTTCGRRRRRRRRKKTRRKERRRRSQR